MSGVYVATTTEDDVQWLTAAGQSVGLSVEPIRYHLAQTLSPAHGALLAEPVEDTASRTTDWYGTGEGETSTLAAASPAMKARATDTALRLLHDIKGEAARLAGSPDADERVLGAMLDRVSHVPDLGCVRVRGDAPIVIAWGHGRAGQSVDLAKLLPPAPRVAGRRPAEQGLPSPPPPGRVTGGSALRFASLFLITAVIAFVATGLLLPTRLREMVIGEDVAGLQRSIDDARVLVRQRLATCLPAVPTTRQAVRDPDPGAPQITQAAPPNASVPPAAVAQIAPAVPTPRASQSLPASEPPPVARSAETAPAATTAAPTAASSSSLAPDTNRTVTATPPPAEPVVAPTPRADQPSQTQPQPPLRTALATDAPPRADAQPIASDDPKPPAAVSAPDQTPAPASSTSQQPGESAAVAPTATASPGVDPQLPLHDSAQRRSPRPFTQAAMRQHDLGMLQGCWTLNGAFATAEKQTRTPVQVSQWRTCFSAPTAGATSVSGSQLLAWADGKSCSGAVTARFGSADKLEITDAGDCLGDRTLFRIVQQCARKDDGTLLCAWSADDRGVGRLRGEGLALSAAP